MEVNLPVWGYYCDGFVDPLYVPYQRELRQGRMQATGRTVGVNVNPYTRAGHPMYSHPAQERKGWGLSFRRMHDYDPCPPGWTPGADAWCHKSTPEQGHGIFYTEDAYLVDPQFWGGYTSPQPAQPEINQFDNRSVSLHSGRHESAHQSFRDPAAFGYRRAPARHAYVAG